MVAHKNTPSLSSKSTSFRSSSFNGSSSTMQTHPYSQLHSNKYARKSTVFDSLFKNAPLKSVNKVTKNPTRRKITELDRCTDIEQKERYRLLIEQHRKETSVTLNIFKTSPTSIKINETLKTTPAKKNISVINLTGETPEPSSRKRYYYKPVLNIKELISGKSNTFSPSPYQTNLTNKRHSLNSHSEVATSTPIVSSSGVSWSASNIVKKKENVDKENPGNNNTSMPSYSVPKRLLSSNKEWLNKSTSPYLAESFISNLISTYGRKERERKRLVAEEETRAKLLRERKKMKDDLLVKMLNKKLQVKEELFAELTPEAEKAVEKALFPHPGQQVLVEKFNISITREHMQTLDGLNWLNDEIINYYMEMIVERSTTNNKLPSVHAMNTFFYPRLATQNYKAVRRWTKKVDIFSKDLILYPIHLGVHWTLAIIDFRSKEITYYDSMGGSNDKCLHTLKAYLISEHLDKKKSNYDTSDWKTITKSSDEIPQQLNGSDCGVFTCTFAEFITRKSPLSFQQKDMPLIRRTMVWEILQKKLSR